MQSVSHSLKNVSKRLGSTKKQKSNYSKKSFVFFNQIITKKDLEEILSWMFKNYGVRKTCVLAELFKESGFQFATQGGISLNLEDLKVPTLKKQLVSVTKKNLINSEIKYKRAELTTSEWFQKQVNEWNATSELLKDEITSFFEDTDPLNPLYMMAFSGARGNLSQVRQLIGMRGLMADQKGEMIGTAIQKNFREGLTVIDFLISSYGARKGLVDTAIRTADSGYMTRRLIDIAQDVIIRQFDCKTANGILITKSLSNKNSKISFSERLFGRILCKPIIDNLTNQVIAHRGQEIDFNLSKRISTLSIESVSLRSPITCQSYRSVCQICFGWDISHHRLIEIGEAVGIIAAQSIGEPGTQLTMRTFHTGGVFSRELSHQIRSKFSGQVRFAPNLKTQFLRSNEGDYGQVIRNASFFEIITYSNQVVRVWVERDDLLMINDNDFIKKGQPIVKSSSNLEESDTEIQKTLSTKFPGEIFYQPRKPYNFFEYNIILWVLAGNLYTLPFEAKKVIRSNKSKNINLLGKTKLVIRSNPFTEKINLLNNNKIGLISRFAELPKTKIEKVEDINISRPLYIINSTNLNKRVILKQNLTANNSGKLSGYIGKFIEDSYKLTTNGEFFSLSLKKSNLNSRSIFPIYNEILKGGIGILLPEETYLGLSTSFLNYIKEGSFIKKDQKLTKKIISPINGIIRRRGQIKKVQQIILNSGVIYKFSKSQICLKDFTNTLDGKFFFPGEIVLDKFLVKKVIFTQTINLRKSVYLLIRPVCFYSIKQSSLYQTIGQIFPSSTDDIVISTKRFLTVKQGEFVSLKKSRNIVEKGLIVASAFSGSNNMDQVVVNFHSEPNKNWIIDFGRSQEINLPQILNRRFQSQNSLIKVLSRPKQVLEPYTVFGEFQLSTNLIQKIELVKTKFSMRYQLQELMIVTNDNVRNFYLDEFVDKKPTNPFIFAGDMLGNNLLLTVGGKIMNQVGSLTKFRSGLPYLFTEGAKIYKNHEDFAPENTVLGFVTYRIFKSQDIIQGLPKIEEILEARGSLQRAFIAEKPGIITKVLAHARSRNSQIEVLSHIKRFRTIREVPYSLTDIDPELLEAEPYRFINLSEKFHKGNVDPQQILETYFEYFKQRDRHHKAVLRSLYKLASIFIKSIQAVYENQGIGIIDRHLEIIIRQMIAKSKVEHPGGTPLVSGEYLENYHLDLLNQMLSKKSKKLVYYKPTILGLTKAALTTESFISAASFQETVRILTQAAIDGKVDWLRGLKEKVIVGGLIPSGTGVLTFLDQWLASNIFFFGRSVVSKRLRHKTLKNRLKRSKLIYANRQKSNSFDSIPKKLLKSIVQKKIKN
uniref:DNA-directed RNA polymerase n=1 Tax=Eustigmatophyceae sp. Mont 10/10-1w TaxID=2506145 RepID=A0A3R5U9R0_9STRA|nr:RNA polymerase b''-subunit [Eustigmatophyceae sp. Mont 10/10-1w]QAA11733.1 RNA polymerase b''-subunit [Eustigmatophyceae sp. Mont 10/10-1w]